MVRRFVDPWRAKAAKAGYCGLLHKGRDRELVRDPDGRVVVFQTSMEAYRAADRIAQLNNGVKASYVSAMYLSEAEKAGGVVHA